MGAPQVLNLPARLCCAANIDGLSRARPYSNLSPLKLMTLSEVCKIIYTNCDRQHYISSACSFT